MKNTVSPKMITRIEWRKLTDDQRLGYIMSHNSSNSIDDPFKLTSSQLRTRRLLRNLLDDDLLVECPGFRHSFYKVFGGVDADDSIKGMERRYKHNRLDLVRTLQFYVKDAMDGDISLLFGSTKAQIVDHLSNLNIEGE